jgi:hypothetical protein
MALILHTQNHYLKTSADLMEIIRLRVVMMFSLQKAIAKYPEKVHYLKSKNTIVTTQPLNDWKSLFYQRVRWASKTSSYQSNFKASC